MTDEKKPRRYFYTKAVEYETMDEAVAEEGSGMLVARHLLLDEYDDLKYTYEKLQSEVERLNKIIAKELSENDDLGAEYTYVNVLKAKLQAAEAELEAWHAITKYSGRSRAEIFGMAEMLKTGTYAKNPRPIPSCNCMDTENAKIHDEICGILEENGWNNHDICTASTGIWAALKHAETLRTDARRLAESTGTKLHEKPSRRKSGKGI